jgi:hypothetical protein
VPLYYFGVRNGSGNLADEDGIELPNAEAAREYACALARELMFRNETRRRHWLLFVRDSEGNELFAMPFVSVDESIQHLSPESRRLIQQTSEKKLALAEAMFASRMGVMRARATIARSRSRPYLAAYKGRNVIAK